MVRAALSSMASGSVENVLVYVSDSLRFDALPASVAEVGVTGRGIATSTFTASGFPSILTGTYPATHTVWSFEDALARRPALLAAFEQSGIDATHVWSNVDDPATKPPLRICGESAETTLSDLDPPFSLVVHDRGGHMLYGRRERADEWATHGEFFDEFGGDRAAIRELYGEGVAESVERFLDIRAALDSRGLLESTLVVFTSDHGELLGEYGGLYGHGTPLVPELVTVPVVFTGAGLPEGFG
ncbi:sulfatase-like hydrolase/transferase [Halomicroarcula sp. GCM10025709]